MLDQCNLTLVSQCDIVLFFTEIDYQFYTLFAVVPRIDSFVMLKTPVCAASAVILNLMDIDTYVRGWHHCRVDLTPQVVGKIVKVNLGLLQGEILGADPEWS